MALTPDQLILEVSPDEGDLKDRIRLVESALMSQYEVLGTMEDGLNILAETVSSSRFMRMHVIKDFEKHGWRVKETDNQMDGHYYTFKPKEEL